MTIARPSEALENTALLRSELDRRTAVTPAMLHSIDESGRLISVSDAWLSKLGYKRSEVIGRLSSDFLTAESRERAVREVVPEFFRSGRCDNVQYQMACKNGRIIDVLISAVLDHDPAGRRVSVAVITDVTALKTAERKLTESEARYRGLVEDQSELVSLATPDGALRYVNHAYASLHGERPEDMVGRSLFDFVPQDRRAKLAEHLQNVCASTQSVADENQVVLPDGRRRWIAWTNRALRSLEGRVTTIHSVGRDIEQRVATEQRLQESEARYRFLADHSTDMILLVGQDGQRFYASPACRTLLGYEPEEMLAIRTKDAIHPDDLDRVLDALTSPTVGGALIYRMQRKDGDYVWVETAGRAVRIVGQMPQRLVIVRDIGQRVAAEQQLRDSETRHRLLAENATDMVFQLDHECVRRYVSPACREIIGYEPEEMLGLKPTETAHPEDAGRLALVFQSLLSGRVDRQSIVKRVRHRDGRWIWVEANLRALKDPDTAVSIGIIGALRDISLRKAIEDELAEANQRLQALVGQDGLTGLANRRAFDEALAREHRRARREGRGLGLIMFDVDGFKALNDREGHLAGDDRLRKIGAEIIAAIRRPGDVAARFGGDEFAALLPDADEDAAAAIAERVREAVALRTADHGVTLSAGVAAAAPGDSDRDAESLLQAADCALYRAKEAGKNIVMRASARIEARRDGSLTAA